jgi:acyl transferase domain-containing protein/NAD(P)H-dependent flavin oxidoreductase YrpB (nitropropane dioxygenase family)/NAD(P)-dependent dehydrogenase (short-subunit alcohol dehydrogenase family)
VDGLIAKGNEAGGWVGEETTFILLQQLLNRVSVPVWAHGGIGLHTSAACYVAGAAGVVLDSQLALTRESSLPKPIKDIIARMDGSETTCLGSELGVTCRVYTRPRLGPVESLGELERTLIQDSRPRSEILSTWRQELRARVGWESPDQHIWLLGQDAAFAGSLAQRFRTVGGVLEGIRQAIDAHIRDARSLKPLDEGTPLARSHGIRYPIVQGPMTRVSDRPSFASKVGEAGGLPFLAFGLLRASELRELLEETQKLLGDRPWGVGIIGFASPDLREEQLELIRAYRPPFALIAGGLPEQALALEQEGIATYLHVASPELLKMFLENGTRRFIFEGRECGGHIGPRSSFVLWNQMIDVLLESLPEDETTNCHVLFAGGIHDALSSSMVASLAAPLAGRGVRVGILMGTAYLFTEEAVSTGAIVKGFQQEALRSLQTMVLETGPGHTSRCAVTRYAGVFKKEKQRLLAAGKSAEEIRNALEELNLGRLSIAAKGIKRNPKYGKDPQAPKYVTVRKEGQRAQGMYMIGQLAALRDQALAIKELHHEVSVEGSQRLADLDQTALSPISTQHAARPCDVAIIGMACLLPKAPNLWTYWENILNKVDAITEVPKERWDWRLYYSRDVMTHDKVNSRWGGFLEEVAFDPIRYGIPPNTLPSIEPLQLLTLEVARAALKDADYVARAFPRERTSVIIGAGGGVADLGQQYGFRSILPSYVQDVSPDLLSRLPEWTEDSFAGILLSVAAGRVANRFDLGGVNYTMDAACASSLAALYSAVQELENETSDMVLVGAADTFQNPFSYLCFSKSLTLSPNGRCRPLDAKADGIVLGEGIAFLVLKRLADAERDGDRIYAVIKAVGGSSDGRVKGLTAPCPEGQALALKRAYAKAGFSPASVGLIEAHGTGTVVGDQVEIEVLKQLFEADGVTPKSCAIGSLKSMIGHTKCTAGMASLIKVALSLHHKVLPPVIGVENPNPILAESPFYVNTEPHPWIHGNTSNPRRAGVSSFGFGGTNFHAVLEEYTGNFLDSTYQAISQHWESELLLWAAESRGELLSAIESLERSLVQGAKPTLRDLAYTLWQQAKNQTGLKLAVVATSLDDLQEKITWVRESLGKAEVSEIKDPRGIYFAEEPLAREGRVASLFPGQGSQYPDMLRDLTIQFPKVREQFELAERVLSEKFPKPLGAYVFPPPHFSEEEERVSMQTLTQTNVAQPAIGAANMGLFHLLQELGVKPNMVAGHSYGEYVALCAGGVFTEEALYLLSEARGRFITEEAEKDLGKMVAVAAGRSIIEEVLESIEGVWIANLNSPEQTVISGTRGGTEEAIRRLNKQGILTSLIPVSCGFHSPIMDPARNRLKEFLSTFAFSKPQLEIYSNATGAPYPQNPKAIKALLSDHMTRPVQFANEIEAMYHAGARIFIEVGPRQVLTNLTQQILGEQPNLTLPLDVPDRYGLLQLHHVLGQLAAHGVPIQLDRLYQGRGARRLNLNSLVEETREKPLPITTWLVNGGRARPLPKTQIEKVPIGATAQEKTDREAKLQGSSDAVPKPEATSPLASTVPDVPPTSQTSETKGSSQEPIASMPNSAAQARPPTTKGASNSPSSDNEANLVMLHYQRLMQRFLETQQQVMLTYLRGSTDKGATVPSEESASGKTSDSPTASFHKIFSSEPVVSPPMPPSEPAAETPETSAMETTAEPGPPASFGPIEAISVEESQPVLDEEQLKVRLLQIVSGRTGYPSEMLDLDLDLEADLGIDSIKRVEIVGALQKAYPHLIQRQGQTAPEELTKRKTLRGIIDWISNTMNSQIKGKTEGTSSAQQEVAANQTLVEGVNEEVVKVPRFLLKAVDAPIDDRPLEIPRDSVFLITDDKEGISQVLVEEIRRLGGRVALVQLGDTVKETGEGIYTADLSNAVSVARFVELVRRQQGPIAGIIHLSPLKTGASFEEMTLSDWQIRLRQEVKSLFYLAKAAGEDLKQAAGAGGSWLVAATSMGHTFASDMGDSGSFSPGHGGIAGLVKTVAKEWPGVRSKVVDLDPRSPKPTLTSHLLREMAGGDGETEVGYRGSRRLVLRTEPASLDKGSPVTLNMDSDWVVLITGGARGVTAEVACELAKSYRPTLLLVGRSPLPEGEESEEIAGLTSSPELKKALMDRMRRAGQQFTLAQVEIAYKKLCQDREMQRNIQAMQKAGAKVQYFQADVRDEHAFGNLIDEIYRKYGRLDGVIHGAGIIEDKLLLDKLPDSFDRVFDTKADSAFILGRKLRTDSLKFLVFFSSTSGCFGSRGQCDYAAANDVVNKLAIHLDKQWPGRIISINWGPWDKDVGMVSSELQKQFAEQGVQLIPRSAGRCVSDEEIRFGRKGHVEVIIGDGPWGSASVRFPLLEDVQLKRTNGGAVEVERTLDPVHDLYLQDHVLDKKPVFPVAMAMELMAEVAQRGWPEGKVVGIRSFRVFRGIVLDKGSKNIHVVARPQTNRDSENSVLEVEVAISDLDKPGHPSYRGTVQLAEHLPEPPPFDPGSLPKLGPFPKTVEEAYKQWLFHGPSFQGITKIEGMSEQGICVQLRSFPPSEYLSHKPGGQWLVDPVVLDSAFQPALLWERAQYDMTPLPSAFTSFRRYGSLSRSSLQCYLQTNTSNDGHMLVANIYFWDEADWLVGSIEKMEFSCSKALNRLAGSIKTYRGNS